MFVYHSIVYVMLADAYEYHNLLFALKLKGLLDTGEYVMIGIDSSRMYNPSDPQIYVKGKQVIYSSVQSIIVINVIFRLRIIRPLRYRYVHLPRYVTSVCFIFVSLLSLEFTFRNADSCCSL